MSAASVDGPLAFLLNSPTQLEISQPHHHLQYRPEPTQQEILKDSVFSMLAKSDSQHNSSHSIRLASPSLPLPSIAIDPQLEQSPRAPHTLPSINSIDLDRRAPSSPRLSPREARSSSDGGFRGDISEHRPDLSLERDQSSNTVGRQSTNRIELPGAAHLLNNTQMPHRVESYHMSSSHGDYGAHRYGGYHVPSPPPITTMTHSPSLSVSSLDHSSTSSPHPPRRPLPRSSLDSAYTDPYYAQEHSSHRHSSAPYPHSSPRSSHAYPYPPRPTSQYRHDSNDSLNSSYQMTSYPTHVTVPSMGPAMPSMRDDRMYGVQAQHYLPVVHTDDATTKLSDRVRRRCFNCCTTDTSTWRRSNLSPGKVLCNKCGLFERTHSRPRPDQFPHRRGSMTAPSVPARMRTPPGGASGQLPMGQSHILPPPHHYEHPSIAPLVSVPDNGRSGGPQALPEVRSWLPSPPTSSSQLPHGLRTQEPDSYRSSPPRARLQHLRGESRTPPNGHSD